MDGTFDKRERAAEAKWALDEEGRFKLYVRRNRRLGAWAAEKMGLSGSAAETYAQDVVKSDFAKPGDEDVFDKVRADFTAKGVSVSDEELRATMKSLLEAALHEVAVLEGKK
jgi:hypothetical protein